MNNDYVCVTGQDGAIYEIYPTEGLVSFLQRLAEKEEQEQAVSDLANEVELSYTGD